MLFSKTKNQLLGIHGMHIKYFPEWGDLFLGAQSPQTALGILDIHSI